MRSTRIVLYNNADANANDIGAVAKFTEGRKDSKGWPNLRKACQESVRLKARLVVAKIGRLRWNLAFLRILDAWLVIEGGQFDCADDETLDERTLSIQIAVARDRAQYMANIMRDKMAEKKKHTKLGFARGGPEEGSEGYRYSKACVAGAKQGAQNAAAKRSLRADYQALIQRVKVMRKHFTWDQIVEILNNEGIKNAKGLIFNRPTLIRIMQRADKANSV